MDSQVNPSIANNKLSQAWNAFVAGDPAASLRALNGRTRLSSEHKEQLRVVQCLQAYSYPALKKLKGDLRREFALVASWNFLLEAFPYQEVWWAKREYLAALLGSDYTLDIDVEVIGIELDGEKPHPESKSLPVAYEQRNELWPELLSLPGLSLAARTLFMRTMKYVQPWSGLADSQRVGLQDIPNSEHALGELSKAGLVDPRPKAADLLMGITLKNLKHFAFEHSVKPHGPKHRLIQEIVAQVEQAEIESLLDTLDCKNYIRPLAANLPLLKKYVWAETHRIEFYLRWVHRMHCLKEPPRKLVGAQRERQTRPRYDPMEPWIWTLRADSDYSPSRGWKRIEKRLVHEIWDANCDKILLDLADKYAWDATVYIGEAIANYLSPEKFETFKQACEQNETRSYYSLLSQYGELRLAQMKVKVREPRMLKCAGCGRQFVEWSVRPSIARRVDYKFRFCADCYQAVFWGSDHSEELKPANETAMLGQLSKLANALGSVPTATFMRDPNLAMVSEEKQITIVKALLAMPSYQSYMETFGSWLRALVLAGVLEDGTQQMARGTRCIAADGHECLSLAEKTIDDWLSAHGVSHEKEPLYPHHARLNPSGMRADWKVQDTLVEYAGLMNEPEYAAKMEAKREMAREFGLSLIILEPEDILNLDQKLGHLCNTSE